MTHISSDSGGFNANTTSTTEYNMEDEIKIFKELLYSCISKQLRYKAHDISSFAAQCVLEFVENYPNQDKEFINQVDQLVIKFLNNYQRRLQESMQEELTAMIK